MLAPENLRDGDLVAVALEPGPGWIPLVRAVWDAGAAILPVDPRLPPAAREALLVRARPTVLLDDEGWTRRDGGERVSRATVLAVHTSGTGALPKLVELDRAAIIAAVASSSLALDATSGDRWLCCLPLAHIGGLLVLLRAVLLRAPVTVHPRFDPAAVASATADFVSVVPTMLLRLLDSHVDLTRFRAILVGGAAVRPDLRRRARRAGAHVIETYGLTETCGGVVYDGRPLPRIEIRIVVGQVELRGPTSMRAYRDDPQRTATTLSPDGWLRTGDAGRLDAEGALHLIGRLDDLITSGGEKVWPQEVEEALSTHPKVADVAVAGRPDAEWGQRVVAFVAPSDPERPPSLGELRDHASATLARFKAPRELVLVTSLPRTASGKVRRAALADVQE